MARDNARLNGVGGRVKIVTAQGLESGQLRRGGPYDLLIANILAGPLIMLAPKLRRIVARGGRTVLSGLLETQAAEVTAAYRAAGFHLERHDVIAGWATLTLIAHGRDYSVRLQPPQARGMNRSPRRTRQISSSPTPMSRNSASSMLAS